MSAVHMLQMTKDQDVTTALYAYLADKKWKGVVILGGIGSVTSMTVANPISHGSMTGGGYREATVMRGLNLYMKELT